MQNATFSWRQGGRRYDWVGATAASGTAAVATALGSLISGAGSAASVQQPTPVLGPRCADATSLWHQGGKRYDLVGTTPASSTAAAAPPLAA